MEPNSIQALLNFAASRQAVDIRTYPSATAVDPLVLALHHDEMKITDLTDKVLSLAPTPLRATGTAYLHTGLAFTDWVNRQKNDQTAIFASVTPNPHMVAVISYTECHEPLWGDYRGVFKLEHSREWKTWMGVNEKPMSQEAFGQFLEDNLADIAPPPSAANPAEAADYQLLLKLGATDKNPAADAARLMTAARNLVIHEDQRLKSVLNSASGEVQFTFEATHTNGVGGTVEVPRIFMVAIPVFDGDAAYRIPVRLRYRKAEGGSKVVFFTSIYQPERYVRDAWGHLMKHVATETGVPVFEGVPEAGGVSGRVAQPRQ